MTLFLMGVCCFGIGFCGAWLVFPDKDLDN